MENEVSDIKFFIHDLRVTKFFRQLFRSCGDDIDVFGHAALVDVRVDGHRAEQRRVLTLVQEINYALLDHSLRSSWHGPMRVAALSG